ncbi:MAG: ThiF family adenylyltransferase [Candidatus Gracilibacteria bacterium]|nr:ThiF family adenylyltransferase [Candidatus Gracilibacteria bacterium]
MEASKKSAYETGTENPRINTLIKTSLSEKKVTVIGLGGGGEIALHLLRSGIVKQNLIDNDILESGNLVRHICGSRFIGNNKAFAVKELLDEYAGNQVSSINAYDWNIFDNRTLFYNLIHESDVVVCATDTDSSRYFINEVCIELRKPAIFVSMFEKGAGGEIFTYIPDFACYCCLADHGERKDFLKKYSETTDKKDCSSARDVSAAPGIGIDQSFLCSIAARKALDVLLADVEHSLPPVGTNWILWSLFGIANVIDKHLSSMLIMLEKQKDCIICNQGQ